jgi:site-specific recombinase XerD
MKFQEKFPDFLNHLRMIGRAEKTVKSHKFYLEGSMSHCQVFDKEISDLCMNDADAVIDSGKRHGETGMQRSALTLRMYLQYLEDIGITIPFNFRRIKIPTYHKKEKRVLTKEDALMVLNTFPINDDRTGTRRMARSIKTVCEVMLGSTMRIHECLSLRRDQWDEIKSKQETIIKGKGGDERTVYFTNRSIIMLDQYLKDRTDLCSAMFVNSYGCELTYMSFKGYLLRFRKQFPPEIQKDLSSHIFRRSMTTWLLNNGMNIKEVQVIGGWKSERTILRHYWKVKKEEAKKNFNQITMSF